MTSTPAVQVEHIRKTFGDVTVVEDVSFEVRPGEIFGLLGPNGAGKTTTIRMMLDIYKPDTVRVAVLGGPMSEAKKDRIGYMPEERGLYQDTRLDRCLVYLGTLKGLTTHEAKRRSEEYLERFSLIEHRRKKVKELSKGMQQKAQIIATLLHHPQLLIIDEPFSGLDPINTQMVKDLLVDLRQQGAAIIMSTHQMHQVEELCDSLLLMNKGRTVLHGDLHTIRRRFMGHELLLRLGGEVPALPGVNEVLRRNGSYLLKLAPQTNPQMILDALMRSQACVEKFEIAVPGLDEIFIRVVKETEAVAA